MDDEIESKRRRYSFAGRPKTSSGDLPVGMYKRTRNGKTRYYFGSADGTKALGSALEFALEQYRELARIHRPELFGLSPTKLLSAHELFKRSKPLKLHTGVYFLFRGDQLIYIGKASNFHRRMADHMGGGRQFDRVAFIECPADKCSALEAAYIRALQPEENIALKSVSKIR